MRATMASVPEDTAANATGSRAVLRRTGAGGAFCWDASPSCVDGAGGSATQATGSTASAVLETSVAVAMSE